MITALLGLAIFGERLPALWWVGAAGLVVGNVIIGRREEKDVKDRKGGEEVSLREADGFVGEDGYRDREVERENEREEDMDEGVVK